MQCHPIDRDIVTFIGKTCVTFRLTTRDDITMPELNALNTVVFESIEFAIINNTILIGVLPNSKFSPDRTVIFIECPALIDIKGAL
ncbi:hypothetical protein AT574_14175 [Phaeobacter inhibens]|nr:hypothetical protein AT574_14175 [Phaeobacter inhibens]